MTKAVDFNLLETILFEPDKGFYLLDLHLERLQTAVREFKELVSGTFSSELSECHIKSMLNEKVPKDGQYYRVRLLVDTSSRLSVTHTVLDKSAVFHDTLSAAAASAPTCRIVLDKQALELDPRDLFIRHKTTNRALYDAARERAQCTWDMSAAGNPFDVVLFNKGRHVAETTIANIAVRTIDKEGKVVWKTPQLSCGLLPGVCRASLLQSQNDPLVEDVITVDDLIQTQKRGDPIVCFNSVRKAYRVELLLTIDG